MIKRMLKTAFYWTAILGTMTVVFGCGKSSDDQGTPGTGGPGYTGGVVTPLPGGGAQINFTGTNVYASPDAITGGTIPSTTLSCSYSGCFCGTFTGPFTGTLPYYNNGYTGQNYYPYVTACWGFTNSMPYKYGTGTISMGGNGAVGGSATYTGTSIVEPGATFSISVSPVNNGVDFNHANVSGSIILPPAFVQANSRFGMPGVVNVAFDMNVHTPNTSSSTLTGGVILYSSDGHGVFLSIWNQ